MKTALSASVVPPSSCLYSLHPLSLPPSRSLSLSLSTWLGRVVLSRQTETLARPSPGSRITPHVWLTRKHTRTPAIPVQKRRPSGSEWGNFTRVQPHNGNSEGEEHVSPPIHPPERTAPPANHHREVEMSSHLSVPFNKQHNWLLTLVGFFFLFPPSRNRIIFPVFGNRRAGTWRRAADMYVESEAELNHYIIAVFKKKVHYLWTSSHATSMRGLSITLTIYIYILYRSHRFKLYNQINYYLYFTVISI